MTELTLLLRTAILVLGVTAVGIGSHAYFKSNLYPMRKENESEFCKIGDTLGKVCPPLALETCFISITIIVLILSSSLFLSSFCINNKSIKCADPICQIVAGISIIVGGACNIYSAFHIWFLTETARAVDGELADRNQYDFFDEKLAAGVISIINGILYLVVGFLGLRPKIRKWCRRHRKPRIIFVRPNVRYKETD